MSYDDHNTYKIMDLLKISLTRESDKITNETRTKLIGILEKLLEAKWHLADELMREVKKSSNRF